MKADEVNPLLPYGSGIFAIGFGKKDLISY
jgi:hypothetical protein